MAIIYKDIIQLDTEAALALTDYIETQKPAGAKTKKALLSVLSGLIDTDIRADIIADTISAIKAVGGLDPAGSVQMFGGTVAPSGWVFCDNASLLRAGTYADLFAIIGTTYGTVDGNHFNVPDFRGIFPRGAGTSAKLSNANGSAFAGVLGTYQNDKMQGHKHSLTNNTHLLSSFAGTSAFIGGTIVQTVMPTVGSPTTDGVNGVPRTGAETNPANLGINFIIKY